MYRHTLILFLYSLLALPAIGQQGKASTPSAAALDSLQAIANRAEQGDAAAQNSVGGWYYRGENFKQDYGKAVQWWLRAMKQGYAAASANLAKCYLRGHGVETDSVRAAGLVKLAIKQGSKATLKEYSTLADQGDRWSARILADIYQNGLGDRRTGVAHNPELYAHYLEIAATPGDPTEQLTLALAYLNADNAEKAYAVFLPLARQGDPSANFWVGKMLLEGIGVKQDKSKGVDYLLRAADSDMPMAAYYLGRCSAIGDGMPSDQEQAVNWYRQAAHGGNHYGQYYLARALAEGCGTQTNMHQALHWFERAAIKGHRVGFTKLINDTIANSPFATYVRGVKLMKGGAYDEALNQFKILEKTNKDEAHTMQGIIYCSDDYSAKNLKKGLKLIKSAAKSGSPLALYTLGMYCIEGKGIKANLTEGIEYLRKASEAGVPEAMIAMANMAFEGRGMERDYSLAASLYEQAATMMPLTPEARRRYASIYEQGMGDVKADPDKAAAIIKAKDTDLLQAMLKTITVVPTK